MKKNFSLEAILTAITGTNYMNHFSEFYDLACFVFDTSSISRLGLVALKDILRNHLLQLYPQLAEITYNAQLETNFDAWVNVLKRKYGKTLPVCPFRQEFSNEPVKSKCI